MRWRSIGKQGEKESSDDSQRADEHCEVSQGYPEGQPKVVTSGVAFYLLWVVRRAAPGHVPEVPALFRV